jgi:SAM-dependent methyltransferase
VLELAVCPGCRANLRRDSRSWSCASCGVEYPVVDHIPVLLPDNFTSAKAAQVAHFDSADSEFEITRPHGTPALHHWLLREKFRRSVSDIHAALRGATALVVCGGSGLDAEFLAETGAHVLATDIALGAVARARRRAERYGFELEVVCADAESLPFRDSSIDFVYVHDGLHHLEDPFTGLAEMVRVARKGISLTEPADAAVTHLAVRAGIALAHEAAGNDVARLAPESVVEFLEDHGFRHIHASRYLMYYSHEPGVASRVLSRSTTWRVGSLAFHALNLVVGRFGNKLTVQAVRP